MLTIKGEDVAAFGESPGRSAIRLSRLLADLPIRFLRFSFYAKYRGEISRRFR